ncbi:deiodinase-like protein [Pseudoalteromonas sp. ZZD1]|uniref:deiodinase-like protein n=1 Tax=Pseudoalteromonas sp. ZZD1 TaxID=3139395 RepID=UPI003BA957CF
MKNYNYDEFTSKNYDLDNFYGPDIGEKAMDFALTNTDGQTVHLLDFSNEFLVLELGSITCPLFQGRREGMARLVSLFPTVNFSVLYVREAHPGSNIPSHKSAAEKISCAIALKNDQEIRSILIDDIKGTAHDAYGGYPNAVFIINRNGCIVYRSDWNNVSAIKKALNRLLSGKPANSKSYFLPVKPTIALKTLKRSGQGAIKDFLLGLPTLIWKNVIKRNVLLFFNLTKTVSPDKRC